MQMEKGLRVETRRRLRWCLDQEGEFGILDCAKFFDVDPGCIGSQFSTLERHGVLAHRLAAREVGGVEKVFCVVNRDKGEALVGTVLIRRAPTRIVLPRVNSVFALGSV